MLQRQLIDATNTAAPLMLKKYTECSGRSNVATRRLQTPRRPAAALHGHPPGPRHAALRTSAQLRLSLARRKDPADLSAPFLALLWLLQAYKKICLPVRPEDGEGMVAIAAASQRLLHPLHRLGIQDKLADLFTAAKREIHKAIPQSAAHRV